ncbi:MAG: hypothetical protein OEY49_19160, partial [Candidatus Heimdallarchaeota archaeon]|nr:hypothetical protein [Candidatus Heimdallarchaeota archaeon]
GISPKPVLLEMVNDNVQLIDATNYWGKGVFDVHDDLVSKYDVKIRTALIGPAGENKVRYAAIINDKNRAAARGGPGAVMGSKLLKGIIAFGTKRPEIANEQKFKETNETYRHTLVKEAKIKDTFGVYGTSGGIGYLNKNNILPTKNFKHGQFEGHNTITGQFMEESGLLIGRDTCSACTTFCKRKIEGEYKGHKLTEDGSSLEYETLAAFGSMLLNSNVKLNGYANQLCNDYGLDTISTGGSLAFVMEATERGMNDALGVSIEWGNEDQVVDALHKISTRDGYGDILAEGVMRMADLINGKEFAMHAKGLEIAYHEARGKIGLGLSYAVSPRGGTHMEGFHDSIVTRENSSPKLGALEAMKSYDPTGKAPVVINFENARSFTNNLIICAFDVYATGKYFNLDYLRELTEAAMGINLDFNSMLDVGARSYNILRMVAVREGCSRSDDDLPDRFKYEPLIYDENVESKISDDVLDTMISEYYEVRGWDEEGKPTEKLQKELNLPAY